VQEDDMEMNRSLDTPWWTLRIALGLTAFLAGADKFTNLLADWPSYLSPLVSRVVDAGMFMRAAGVIEMAAGVLLLAGITRLGGYIVAAWLVGISLNLLTTGQYFDIAVRDLVMACAAFSLAKLSEARQPERAGLAQPGPMQAVAAR
jgi:uncharacterized membrane protein YphA (DoxX/SURF4 family)